MAEEIVDEVKYKNLMKEYLAESQEVRVKIGKKDFVIQYFLDHGRNFEPEPLTADETIKLTFSKKLVKPKAKSCFYNAWRLWADNHDFKYCEGYISAFPDEIIMPIYHAWNCIHGKLVDITPLGGYLYFGAVLPDEVVDSHFELIKRDKEWVPIIDNWRHEWPFLKEEGYL